MFHSGQRMSISLKIAGRDPETSPDDAASSFKYWEDFVVLLTKLENQKW